MAEIKQILVGSDNYDIRDNLDYLRRHYKKTEVTGVAGTSKTQLSSTYDVTDSKITSYYDGMMISFVLPVVGVTTYGSVFQINSLGYKPIVYNTNSIVGTRYPVGGQITMVYNSTQTAGAYLTKATKTTITGCWQICDYDTNTTDAYALIDYNFRPYAGSAIYRYKLCLQDKDNRLQPIVTTNQESTTQVVKTVNTTPLRPEQIWFYNDTTTVAAGSTTAKYKLMASDYGDYCSYNFNAAISSYRMIYLAGSYNETTGLFTLDNSTSTSYYATVPNQSANITLSSYLTAGKYYILVGSSYSSNDEFQLFVNNPMYYFDGTNLIPSYQKEINDKVNKSGDTMTGALTLSGAPTADLHASTKKYVDDSISALPSPMVYKGTVGTGGTVTTLPTSGVRIGDTYKVITDGTYAGQAAKVGDLFIATAATPTWSHVPAGDEPGGTVTSVSVKMNDVIKGTVTTSGTIDLGTVVTDAVESDIKTVNNQSLLGSGNIQIDVPTKTSDLTNDSGFLTSHQDISGKQDKITSSNKLSASLISGLANVATSGSYTDLSNKPTIPTTTSQLTNDSGFITSSYHDDTKVDDYTLRLYAGSSGNPRSIKFLSINYTGTDSNNAIFINLKAIACHPNGSSYKFMEEIIIGVDYAGNVGCDVKKTLRTSCGTVDGQERYYGDVFYTVDTTSKIVDFYIFGGQWAEVKLTPYKRRNGTSGGTITQLSGTATYYSSGTKVYGNNTFILTEANNTLTVPVVDAGLNYVTTAPTDANTNGIKFAILNSEPATKYNGWVYLITEE